MFAWFGYPKGLGFFFFLFSLLDGSWHLTCVDQALRWLDGMDT
jgi:hypothetical protein